MSQLRPRPVESPPLLALHIRQRVLQSMGSIPATGDDAGLATACPVSIPAWRLFLDSERCARALVDGMQALPVAPDARAEIEECVRERARRETQRVLTARAQLRNIASIASAKDFQVVVLKGGAAVAADHALDLADLDLLVRPESAGAFASELEDIGYSVGLAGRSPRTLRHRLAPDKLPVDIHLTTDPLGTPLDSRLWSRCPPLPGFPRLWILPPAEHVWHVLRHSAVEHFHRRGRIRDLLLIRLASRRCSPTDLQQVEDRLTGHPLSVPLAHTLELALAMKSGKRETKDHFRQEAAMYYLLWRWIERGWIPRVIAPQLVDAGVAWLGSSTDRSHLLRYAARPTSSRNRPALSDPHETFGTVGRERGHRSDGSRRLLRVVRMIGALGAGLPLSLAARVVARVATNRTM